MSEDKPNVIIYTDGACSGNPGPGGWGAVLFFGIYTKELSGGCADTTNNRMEMTAIIEALSALKRPCKVTLYSDSNLIVSMVEQGHLQRWAANNWMRGKKEPVKNRDLWEKILTLLLTHEVEMIWVKGHAENQWNNRCDELAVNAMQPYKL